MSASVFRYRDVCVFCVKVESSAVVIFTEVLVSWCHELIGVWLVRILSSFTLTHENLMRQTENLQTIASFLISFSLSSLQMRLNHPRGQWRSPSGFVSQTSSKVSLGTTIKTKSTNLNAQISRWILCMYSLVISKMKPKNETNPYLYSFIIAN